jgi:xanthine dehydrogenase accessory factor
VLWVAGATPIASSLAALAAASGWRVSAFDPLADPAAFPAADRVVVDAALPDVEPGRSPYVVIATQGTWDEEAAAAALARDVAYVGLVASPTRAAVVRAWLREDAGLPDERVAALRAPAGLDIGAETADEVALSILAELVQVRRGRAPFVAAPGPAAAVNPAAAAPIALIVDDIVLLDPVCGMTVDRDHARHLAEHDGVVYAFCSLGCRSSFIREPAAYLPAGSLAT